MELEIHTIYRLDGKPYTASTSQRSFETTEEALSLLEIHNEKVGATERAVINLIKRK